MAQRLVGVRAPAGLPAGAQLFVKSDCGHSRAALLTRDNLHLEKTLTVKNVSEDASARSELTKLAGKDQAPALVCSGEVIHEAADITNFLVSKAGDL